MTASLSGGKDPAVMHSGMPWPRPVWTTSHLQPAVCASRATGCCRGGPAAASRR